MPFRPSFIFGGGGGYQNKFFISCLDGCGIIYSKCLAFYFKCTVWEKDEGTQAEIREAKPLFDSPCDGLILSVAIDKRQDVFPGL